MQRRIDEGTWKTVIESLEALLPYYERTNFINTWFLLPLWRRELSNRVGKEDLVLEIGSGPGGLARLLGCRRAVCLDPSVIMLRYVRDRLENGRFDFVSALAESLPIASNRFDKILCSFSFRDFMDKRHTFAEMLRVLKPGGSIHILELLRPSERWRRAFMDMWIEKAVPVIARVLVPQRVARHWGVNPYASFAWTYKSMAPIEDYVGMAKDVGFSNVTWRFLGMKSIFHLQGVKPRST